MRKNRNLLKLYGELDIKLNKSKNKTRLNEESTKILLQCIIAELAFTIILMIILTFIKELFNQVIWYWEDPMYRFLKYFEERDHIFIPILLFIGWIFISIHFISKLLKYLDEISTAAESLAKPTNEPIILSNALHDTEKKLNRVRLHALENTRAAKEAEQRKNDLVAYLAHDLKTPLTSVIGYLTILKEDDLISNSLRQKYLSISLAKAERLEELINEFFEITQFNISDISLNYSEINLTLLLQQLTSEFEPMLRESNLQCELDLNSNIMISCDVDKLQRVFDNLLRNAINYSFPNTTILISCKLEADHVYIEFKNHGHTISPEKLKMLFEQFYRVDASRNSTNGGTGLGLAIAKEIIEHHKGTIHAESQNNIISFIVHLPTHDTQSTCIERLNLK